MFALTWSGSGRDVEDCIYPSMSPEQNKIIKEFVAHGSRKLIARHVICLAGFQETLDSHVRKDF